jgi:hypothetical protein
MTATDFTILISQNRRWEFIFTLMVAATAPLMLSKGYTYFTRLPNRYLNSRSCIRRIKYFSVSCTHLHTFFECNLINHSSCSNCCIPSGLNRRRITDTDSRLCHKDWTGKIYNSIYFFFPSGHLD